jgi:hypothetical protein
LSFKGIQYNLYISKSKEKIEVSSEIGKTKKKKKKLSTSDNLSTDERFTIKLDVNFCHLAVVGVREAGLQKYS